MNSARRHHPATAGSAGIPRVLLLSFLLVPACFGLACGRTDPGTPRIADTWKGQDEESGRWEFELSGSESLSGTYLLIIIDDLSSLDGELTGRYDYPSLSLNFEIAWFADRIQSCEYVGTMAESGETIAGTVTCSADGQSWSSGLDLRRDD